MSFAITDIPPQDGKIIIVTGANSGIGYETALALAGAGATLVLAGRSRPKGLAAVQRIEAAVPGAKLAFEELDLASLASVAAFAARVTLVHPRIDVLINNAGVMMLPSREVTADGFERQIGTNFLGPFALTAHLLPALAAAKARVIQLSSIAARRASMNIADLQATRSYGASKVYGQSKLAMLMFALELQRRSDAHGWGLTSMAAHPGVASTGLIDNGIGTGLVGKIGSFGVRMFGQSAAAGALPSLFAATSPLARPGGYYGSVGWQEIKGPVGAADIVPAARDLPTAAALWDLAAQLTGVTFALPAPLDASMVSP